MYETILVATDGSDRAGDAATTAIAFAERFGASLIAVHVSAPDEAESATVTGELARRGASSAAGIVDRANDAGVSATTVHRETTGGVARAISDTARDRDADLVVIGTQGRSGIDRIALGSVTERTLRIASVPVLAVSEPRTSVESVLLPTDGSPGADAAADHAIGLAAELGASMHALHVVDPSAGWGQSGDVGVLEAMETAGRQTLEAVRDRATPTVGSIETALVTGSPARSIADYATDESLDLIVMGTRGRTGLARQLLGSVTERTVRLSSTAVLAVPTPES